MPRFNNSLLRLIIERDKCIINLLNYPKLNRDTKIEYICQCGNIGEKFFRWMFEKGGGFCIDCVNKNSLIKNKQTCLEKYGVEYSLQSEKIREKGKRTNLERYGSEYPLQSDDIKNKTKETNLKRYGVENPSQLVQNKTKKKETCMKNYGVENPAKSEKIQKKIKQTNLIRYGVEHPLQNPDIAEKGSYKIKQFIFPDGKNIKVQGYEPYALRTLLGIGYNQTDLITSKKDVPKIWYSDIDGKKHRYYCDIYIPSENKIIEVKNTWTYKKDLHINTLKSETCKEEGYNFEFWIVDKDNKTHKVLQI